MILGNMFLTILQPSQLRSLNCHSFAGSIAGSVTRSAKRRLLLQLGCNPDQTVIPTLVQQKLIRWNTVNLSCLVDRWLCRYACKKSPSMLDELKSWMKFELWGWRNDKMSKRHNQQRCLSISWTKYVNCCIWSYRNLTDTNRPYFFSRHFTNAILEVPPHTLLDVLNIKIFHLCIFCQSGRALQYQPMETIYMILLWVMFFCVFQFFPLECMEILMTCFASQDSVPGTRSASLLCTVVMVCLNGATFGLAQQKPASLLRFGIHKSLQILFSEKDRYLHMDVGGSEEPTSGSGFQFLSWPQHC